MVNVKDWEPINRGPPAVEGQCCGTCRHFDKTAFPENKRFGKCRAIFKLPPMPMWAIPIGRDGNVADYYRASGCETYSANDRAAKP
jgi:hypothetical protein